MTTVSSSGHEGDGFLITLRLSSGRERVKHLFIYLFFLLTLYGIFLDDDDNAKGSITGEGSMEGLHRCLTCLGDLTRYMLDLPSPPPHTLSVRYYLQVSRYRITV